MKNKYTFINSDITVEVKTLFKYSNNVLIELNQREYPSLFQVSFILEYDC